MDNKTEQQSSEVIDLGSAAEQTKGAVLGIADTLGQPRNFVGLTDD
jgi:hypothetical protein